MLHTRTVCLVCAIRSFNSMIVTIFFIIIIVLLKLHPPKEDFNEFQFFFDTVCLKLFLKKYYVVE